MCKWPLMCIKKSDAGKGAEGGDAGARTVCIEIATNQ